MSRPPTYLKIRWGERQEPWQDRTDLATEIGWLAGVGEADHVYRAVQPDPGVRLRERRGDGLSNPDDRPQSTRREPLGPGRNGGQVARRAFPSGRWSTDVRTRPSR